MPSAPCELVSDPLSHQIGDKLSIPSTLDLSPYLTSSSSSSEGAAGGVRGGPRYALTSVILHEGANGESGHYVTLCQHEGQWFECNDHMVSELSEQEVLKRAAGVTVMGREGRESVTGYVMMYSRIDEEEGEEEEDSASEEDGEGEEEQAERKEEGEEDGAEGGGSEMGELEL